MVKDIKREKNLETARRYRKKITKEGKILVTFKLDKRKADRLLKIADEYGVSRSTFIEMVVELWMTESEGTVNPELYARAVTEKEY